jgi:hypothetical protein
LWWSTSSLARADSTLDLLTPDELAEAHRFVEVWERTGYMGPAEASAWRERIAIWQRFRVGRQAKSVKPVMGTSLLDDPDPFLA